MPATIRAMGNSKRRPVWAMPIRTPLSGPTVQAVIRGALFFLFVVLVWALWKWPAHYPHPDIWLGADLVGLAVLGVFVSLRGPVSLAEKIIYASVCILFAVVGLKLTIQQSIETESAEKETSATLQKVATSTDETQRLTRLNTQLQNQLLGQSANISSLAEKSFNTITGAGSFPYIVPQPASYPNPIPLFVWDHGQYMLTGVTITIRRSDDFNFYQPPLDIGVLHSGWGKPLSVAILPKPDPKTGEDIFLIDMYTQSETFTEIMHFRRSRDGKTCDTKFWVDKSEFGNHVEPPSYLPKAPKLATTIPKNGSITFPVYDRSQWSDEPQDVKKQVK